MAVLLAGQVALGLAADWSPREEGARLLNFHVQFGLTILAFVVVRLLWRFAQPPPLLPPSIPRVQVFAARAVHGLLYGLIFLLPVSGYLLWMWIGAEVGFLGLVAVPFPSLVGVGIDEFWRSFAGYTHEYAFYAFAVLVMVHVTAAAWHELILRDGLVRRRML